MQETISGRNYALGMGVIFLILGVSGFIQVLSPNGYVFGLFASNVAHNWLHILSGLLGVLTGLSHHPGTIRRYVWFLLITYGFLTVAGFLMIPENGFLFNLVHINMADNWLHLLIFITAAAVLVASYKKPVYRL